MRNTPRGIVEELREAAHLDAIELGADEGGSNGCEAADYIEYLTVALERIRAGEPDSERIAHDALDQWKWMLS